MPKDKVKEVIDGDTIKLPYNKFVRLARVDAPEKNKKGGSATRQKLEELVEGKTISYTEDAKSYSRIVGRVKVGKKDVNKAMNNFIKKMK